MGENIGGDCSYFIVFYSLIDQFDRSAIVAFCSMYILESAWVGYSVHYKSYLKNFILDLKRTLF